MGIVNYRLRVHQRLVFLDDLLLDLVDIFVLSKSYLRLFLEYFNEFVIHDY